MSSGGSGSVPGPGSSRAPRGPVPPGSEQVAFLEEWKAKRERLRLRSSGNGTGLPCPSQPAGGEGAGAAPSKNPAARPATQTCQPPPSIAPRAGIATTPAREESAKEERIHKEGAGLASPSPRGKEQKGGASAHRKNKTQVEKRKLREKRRSTGVVNLPLATESPDEGEGGAASEKQGHPDLPKSNLADAPRVALTRQKSWTGVQDPQPHPPLSHKQSGGPGKPGPERETPPLERRLHELEKVVSGEKQVNQRLSRQLQEKEGLILKLQAEIGHMSEDLDGLEQENHTLREENQTLLRVVGQLTSS
ncbi:PRKC apoptosis WT1 regulator protein-like [Polyodon spathula]|uniref:PRKC apoptosis WT1 regulator protein-like n=1 Tax=Polyodon spathula TaxID=7913 RepID=UPI001B7EAA21|nr:PRKC apoptosis WT1 regulator protein-like [Polyodon spathula]XP_041131283.1 PRKC apoptosis WT1 regulator protein-like [Polyodon spathula]XP_041131284.1 PRKC apoptosis WT1 regulator protein-like [Polyodon spathula]